MKLNEIKKTPVTIKPLKWKGRNVEGYFISSDGDLYHGDRRCRIWQVNGRNYGLVTVDGHSWSYRIDYMVAYTFKEFFDDVIRLVHIDGDLTNDQLDNLMWFRKSDVSKMYQDMAIIESDGSIKEEWRPCRTEYNESLGYEVSNLGFIRDKNHEMIPIYESHGYRVFYYSDPFNAHTTRIKAVHRAVAEAFIPNPNGYGLVNHLDGNKFNDVILNLEWANDSMNMEHAYLQGLNRNSSYTPVQVEAACKLLATTNISQVQISYMTGIDRKTLSDIYRGRRWAHISSKYNMRSKKWPPALKMKIRQMIIDDKKGKEIFSDLNITYDQSAISLYERLRRELKSEGKVA